MIGYIYEAIVILLVVCAVVIIIGFADSSAARGPLYSEARFLSLVRILTPARGTLKMKLAHRKYELWYEHDKLYISCDDVAVSIDELYEAYRKDQRAFHSIVLRRTPK